MGGDNVINAWLDNISSAFSKIRILADEQKVS